MQLLYAIITLLLLFSLSFYKEKIWMDNMRRKNMTNTQKKCRRFSEFSYLIHKSHKQTSHILEATAVNAL